MIRQPIPPQLESSFQAYLAEERIRSAREISVLASVLYLLFGVLDIWAIPSALAEVWALRAAVIVLMIGFFCTTWHPLFIKHYASLTISLFLVMGMGIESMLYLTSWSTRGPTNPDNGGPLCARHNHHKERAITITRDDHRNWHITAHDGTPIC